MPTACSIGVVALSEAGTPRSEIAISIKTRLCNVAACSRWSGSVKGSVTIHRRNCFHIEVRISTFCISARTLSHCDLATAVMKVQVIGVSSLRGERSTQSEETHLTENDCATT